MLILLIGFAVLHSGGASLRAWGAEKIGERRFRHLAEICFLPR